MDYMSEILVHRKGPDIVVPKFKSFGRGGSLLKSYWSFRHFNREGRLIWENSEIPNIFHDEGEEFVCDVIFNETQSVPANYYYGLDNRGSLTEADVLPVTGEPSSNGYARQTIASDAVDWTVSQDVGDYQAVSATQTFNASGGSWGPVANAFLTTANDSSGPLIASVALSASRTLQDGDSLQSDITIKISE